MRPIGIGTDTPTEEVAVRKVEVKEHLVLLFSRIAETSTRKLGGNVIDRTHATALVSDVETLQKATAGRIEVSLFKSFATLFYKDLRFLEDFGLRRVNGERGIAHTHVTQVKVNMLIQDCTVVAEPVANHRIVVFVVSALPVLVQTQLDINHGLRTRTSRQTQVHICEGLVFLRRGFRSVLIRRREGSESASLCRTVNLQAQHSCAERIQLFQQGLLLRNNLSLVIGGKCRCSRECDCGGQ